MGFKAVVVRADDLESVLEGALRLPMAEQPHPDVVRRLRKALAVVGVSDPYIEGEPRCPDNPQHPYYGVDCGPLGVLCGYCTGTPPIEGGD